MNTATGTAVRLERVSKTYGHVTALDDVTWEFPRGRLTAVMGPSGSGKSTFLHCASGLDRPTSGSVRIGEVNLNSLSEAKRTRLRRDRIGFVFQAFNLIPSMTVEQNVTLPLRLAGREADPALLAELVRRVGLADRTAHRPSELSGGQQQRAAIARALITEPDVVFADEPTGALDPRTAREVLRLLREAVDALGRTIVLVTHDPVAAAWADSVLFLDAGRIVDELARPSVEAVRRRWEVL
ncbi:ABC transporter [Actinomadura sp. NBRC 104412]|uniref:ABC transporter ATP-binding protein n=1 Tax=Actinomadura sp. NBRC 104412 TaxID=3032203 RepID=UPI0024A27D03|nr:ABC transporter ATP-binding protein [Actinomadura sp. NBRC 104412]GLZ06844.1 ABC transporter [Actinomadura sp. NBRC 104412]